MFLFHLKDIAFGFIFFIFFSTIGVILIFSTRSLYYHDVDMLNLEQKAQMDKTVIIDNYDALMDYISPKYSGRLILPNFTVSKDGEKHFKDVKNLYKTDCIFAIISGIAVCAIVISRSRAKDFGYLFLSSICSILFPLIGIIGMLYDFKQSMYKFQKFLFNDDYYAMNKTNDPVVTILPNQYLLHCAFAVLVFSIICGLCLFIVWKGYHEKSYFAEEEASAAG